MVVKILALGGIIQSLGVPDRDGRSANVVLGFNDVASYLASRHYFGAIIGRYANRIAGGRLNLNGTTYQLSVNDGTSSLHGGSVGFDKALWDATAHGPSVTLRRTSPDGEMGYPASLDVEVTYALGEDNALRIDYSAVNKDDSLATVVNLTNHSYFNLAGEGTGDVYGHELQISASHFTPVDSNLIPTGEIARVAGTAMDFTGSTPIGARPRGYDLNWVLDRPSQFDHSLIRAATLTEPRSGRVLEVHTTEPGIQFYSGGLLEGKYRPGDGLCLETQHFPDSPNHANFPSTVLDPGHAYKSTTIYRFSTY